MKTKSPAKKQLITFLKESVLDQDYTFEIDVDILMAQDFVHRMRVELSRLRDLARKRDKVPKHFKMLYINSESSGDGKCSITVRKTLSANNVDNEVNDILDMVSSGEKLDG